MTNELMKQSDVQKVKYIRCVLPVRYGNDDIPFDFPFRNDKIWDITIEAESGIILDFPNNISIHMDMKVTDEGIYSLLDKDKNVLAFLHEEYVPDSWTIPGEYGDYILFDIKDGKIQNWYKSDKRQYKEFIE